MTPEAHLRAEPETVRTLELADFLLIAEAVLEIAGQADRGDVEPPSRRLRPARPVRLLRR